MSVIIPRNTSIPYAHTKTYYNNEDNQEEAIIEVGIVKFAGCQVQ